MAIDKPFRSYKLHWLAATLTFGGGSIRLDVYPTKVVYKKGVLSKSERTIPLSKITDVSVRKGCLAGLFGYGNLYIETAGSGGTEVVIAGLNKVGNARDAILWAIDKQEGR